jgi:hypothetical protein
MDFGIVVNILIAFFGFLLTGVSIFLSQKAIKSSQLIEQHNLFCELYKDERYISDRISEYNKSFDKARKEAEKIDAIIKSDKILFDFYEYIALLIQQNAIDVTMFIEYFNLKIKDAYDLFMESPLFENSGDRFFYYQNLSLLFNNLGLSIKEKINEQINFCGK